MVNKIKAPVPWVIALAVLGWFGWECIKSPDLIRVVVGFGTAIFLLAALIPPDQGGGEGPD